MGGLADRTLRELLDQLAAPTPAPGGGCAVAWACALAAGLVEMAAGIARARAEDRGEHGDRAPQLARRAGELRTRALELGEQDRGAYEPVLAALRMPAEDPERTGRLDRALSEAAETPLALAGIATEIAALALDAARTGSPHLRGDALTAALLAESACQAAGRLVAINLAQRPADARLRELTQLTGRAAAIREQAL